MYSLKSLIKMKLKFILKTQVAFGKKNSTSFMYAKCTFWDRHKSMFDYVQA